MNITSIISSTIVGQTVTTVNTLGCMAVLTVLGRSCTQTGCDYTLSRTVRQSAPGAREVAAVAVGYSVVASTGAIVVHMLGQLQLSC